MSASEESNINLLSKEAAARLRVAVSTLAAWRVTGAGPRYIKFGTRVLYPISEIEAFEKKCLRSATTVATGK